MKETIDKIKWRSTEQEKILAYDVPHKGLISKLYKELTKLNHITKANY